MQIICDLIDLVDMLDGVRDALKSPPRANDRLRELRQYICAHCAEKTGPHRPPRCNFCKIRGKNA